MYFAVELNWIGELKYESLVKSNRTIQEQCYLPKEQYLLIKSAFFIWSHVVLLVT